MAMSFHFTGKRATSDEKRFIKTMNDVVKELNEFILGPVGEWKRERKRIEQICIHVQLAGQTKVRSLNRQWRGKDRSTDVLSFALYEDLRRERNLPGIVNLGDIVICREVAHRQARAHNLSFNEEALHLLAHGVLHLLGYDHERSETEERLMQKREERLVEAFYRHLRVNKKGKNNE
jgi:probable rRNA maturation factor